MHFMPDDEVFEEITFSSEVLSSRFREMAFLNPGLKIILKDDREEKEWTFLYEGGLCSFVEYLNRDKTSLFPKPVVISGEKDSISVDMGLQYNDGYHERLFSFANLINTIEGGTHVIGLRSALTRGGQRERQT